MAFDTESKLKIQKYNLQYKALSEMSAAARERVLTLLRITSEIDVFDRYDLLEIFNSEAERFFINQDIYSSTVLDKHENVIYLKMLMNVREASFDQNGVVDLFMEEKDAQGQHLLLKSVLPKQQQNLKLYQELQTYTQLKIQKVTTQIDNKLEEHNYNILMLLIVLGVITLLFVFYLMKILVNKTSLLSTTEGELKAILENAPDGIIILDQLGTIQSFNRAASDMFGYNAEEIFGKELANILDHDNEHLMNVFVFKQNIQNPETHQKQSWDLLGKHKNGQVFPVNFSLSQSRVEDKIVFTGIFHDLTKTKAHEQQLTLAKNDAENANLAKSEFLSRMSHELRTPLNAILGFSQLLEMDDDLLNQEQMENVGEILKAGEHLLHLINEVLDLARIESGKLELTIEEVALNEIFQQSIVLIKGQADAKGVRIIDKLSNKNHIVSADPVRLKQVFTNLLSNAVKYNNELGSITLESEIRDSNILRISITDTGNGFSEEDKNLLFVPFDRLSISNNVEGAGIGLVITRHFLDMMDAKLGADSTVGEGSCFWIEFYTDVHHQQ